MPDLAHAPQLGASRFRRSPLILVVDDDEGARTAICAALREHGCRPIPATQGVGAHWVVERHGAEIALVVTDLLPPAPDGFHLGIPYERLRPYTPVLFTGRVPRAEQVRRGLLHPNAPYLPKPFTAAALVRSVRDAIARWPALPAA